MTLLLILFALLAAGAFGFAWLADVAIRGVARAVRRAVKRWRQRVVCAWCECVMRRGWRSATISHGICRRCTKRWTAQWSDGQRATPPAKAA